MMSDYAVMREQARVCCNGLALHIRFRVDGVAHELANRLKSQALDG